MERILRPRTRRGHALLTTLILALILGAIGMATLTLTTHSEKLAYRRGVNLQALNLAMAGADEAVSQMRSSTEYIKDGETKSWTLPGEGGGTVKIAAVYKTNPNPNLDEPIVELTSTGTVKGGPVGQVSRNVKVVIGQASAVPPAFLKAIVANTDALIKGKVWTTSTPKSGAVGEGDIWANRYLKFKKKIKPMTIDAKGKRKGDYLIDGDADAGMGIYGSTANVSGKVRSGRKPLAFPKVDDTWIAKRVKPENKIPPGHAAKAGEDHFQFGNGRDWDAAAGKWVDDKDSLTMDTDDILESGTYVFPGEENGPKNGKTYKLRVDIAKQGVTIPDGAVVHIKGDVTIRGPVRGKGTLIVDGKIKMDVKDYKGYTKAEKDMKAAVEHSSGKEAAQLALNQEWKKQNILFISRRGSKGKKKPEKVEGIHIHGGAKYIDIKGIFYAPDSAIKMHGKTGVIGGVVGNFVKAEGEARITTDRTLIVGPAPPFRDVLAWQEY